MLNKVSGKLKLSLLLGTLCSTLIQGQTSGTYVCEKEMKLIFNDANVTILHNNVDTLGKVRNLMKVSNVVSNSSETVNMYFYSKIETENNIELWVRIVGMGYNNSDKKATILKKSKGSIIMEDKKGDIVCEKKK